MESSSPHGIREASETLTLKLVSSVCAKAVVELVLPWRSVWMLDAESCAFGSVAGVLMLLEPDQCWVCLSE